MTKDRPSVLILAGRGRYEDPWHDHAAMSHLVAREVAELGCDVEVRSTFLESFGDLESFDLLIVNSGTGRPDPDFDGDDAAWQPNHEAVRDFVASGRPLLGLHQAANTFADSLFWSALLGGRWIPGISMHPEADDATFVVVAQHPITAGLDKVTAFDERYSYLEVAPSSTVLVTQSHDDIDHAVVWTNESHGARVAYDGMGHGPVAFESESRVQLLRQEIEWLLGRS